MGAVDLTVCDKVICRLECIGALDIDVSVGAVVPRLLGCCCLPSEKVVTYLVAAQA